MRVFLSDDDNAFVGDGPVVVQVRRRSMTHATLDTIERFIPEVVESATSFGFVALYEPTAEVPSKDIRERQQRLVRSALGRQGTRVGLVFLATGVSGSILRTISRTMSLGLPHMKTFASVEDVARWMGTELRLPPSSLAQLITQARALPPSR